MATPLARLTTASSNVEVDRPHEPDRVSEEMARAAMARAVSQIQAIVATDPRLGELLDRFGSVYEYVHDCGMGRVLVAVSQGEGDLVWRGHWGPF